MATSIVNDVQNRHDGPTELSTPAHYHSNQGDEFKPIIPASMRDVSTLQLSVVLCQPFVYLAGFGLCLHSGHALLLLPLMLLLGGWAFQTAFTNAHNLVHHAYHLPVANRILRDVLMSLYGLMFGYASHLFQATHYAHHARENRCGGHGDPESVAHLKGWVVLLFGPYFTAQVFRYGFMHARSRFDRLIGLVELGGVVLCGGWAASWFVRWCYGDPTLGVVESTLGLYFPLATVLLWTFPFTAAWLPHRKCSRTMLGQARNTPGVGAHPIRHFIAYMLVGDTRWHLLHHAYMYLASCRLGAVAKLPQVQAWIEQQPEHDHAHGHQ